MITIAQHLDLLEKQNLEMREAIRAVVGDLKADEDYRMGSPCHDHATPGEWNGDKQNDKGAPCLECAHYNELLRLADEPSPAPFPREDILEQDAFLARVRQIMADATAVTQTALRDTERLMQRLREVALPPVGTRVSVSKGFGTVTDHIDNPRGIKVSIDGGGSEETTRWSFIGGPIVVTVPGGEFAEGHVGPVGECDSFQADIDHISPGLEWAGRIVIYGKSPEEAITLRSQIINALQSVANKGQAQTPNTTRWFPMLSGPAIPWEVAEVIYAGYAHLYGRTQTLERMAERGGFGFGEVAVIWKEGRAAGQRAMRSKAEELKVPFSKA